jgi:hypothetical protein
VDVATGTAPGVGIVAESLATWREGVLPLRSRNPDEGHYAVWLGWNNRIAGPDTMKTGKPASYSMTIGDSLRTAWRVGSRTALEFSLSPTAATPEPRAAAKDTTRKDSTKTAKPKPPAPKPPPKPKPSAADSLPIDLSIEVVDAGGTVARVPLKDYGVTRRPMEVTVLKRKGLDKSAFLSLSELVPQTYVIPLADFTKANPRFDPSRLATMRWVFDGTRAGTVVLTDVGLSNIDPVFFTPNQR